MSIHSTDVKAALPNQNKALLAKLDKTSIFPITFAV